MAEVLVDRDAAVVREISKTFEETGTGRLSELSARYVDAPPKGEIVVVVAPPGEAPPPSGRSAGVAGRIETVIPAVCRVPGRLSNALSRLQYRERDNHKRRLANHRRGVGPEGRGAADAGGDLIDVEQAVEGQPQPADDSGAPAAGGVGSRGEKDQPRAEIGEADVADEMRVGRESGRDHV